MPKLLQAISGGYVLENGSFAVLELQLEEDEKIIDLSFGADVESMSALAFAAAQLVSKMDTLHRKGDAPRPPTALGFKSITVEPGNSVDGSAAITLRLTTTSGQGLVFGLPRQLAEELQE